eukprot:TRINITY_DN2585_c0_g2_i1.p1 TRINITY_DN2585_c0_g2~~TRINITY_DN2585_c0_g2_i1.p1  ORF type:complete len:100 (-),score=9.15 TRINITY_DN2585_c0_g2_i1:376-675(-)
MVFNTTKVERNVVVNGCTCAFSRVDRFKRFNIRIFVEDQIYAMFVNTKVTRLIVGNDSNGDNGVISCPLFQFFYLDLGLFCFLLIEASLHINDVVFCSS